MYHTCPLTLDSKQALFIKDSPVSRHARVRVGTQPKPQRRCHSVSTPFSLHSRPVSHAHTQTCLPNQISRFWHTPSLKANPTRLYNASYFTCGWQIVLKLTEDCTAKRPLNQITHFPHRIFSPSTTPATFEEEQTRSIVNKL